MIRFFILTTIVILVLSSCSFQPYPQPVDFTPSDIAPTPHGCTPKVDC